jgi:1,2-dihydroxy-3-keto-5-methylthiopentene dioxygenase
MATLTVRDSGQILDEAQEIRDFLSRFGIWYRRFDGDVPDTAGDDDVLSAFADPIRELKAEGGYVTADVVTITPETPDEMLAKFVEEHTHDDDEVRFIVDGRGLFHIHPAEGPVFCIEVVRGDLINVPKGTRHWFHVCEARSCRAVRLFRDPSGWTPRYTGSGVERSYPPVWHGSERI